MPNFSPKDLAYAGYNTASNSDYSNLNTIFKLSFIGLLISLSSCEKEKSNKQHLAIKNQSKNYTPNRIEKRLFLSDQLYHYSPTNNRKYDYNITGTDENGKKVKGIINIENEIAIGILKGNGNREIEIISDLINNKEIIATDINGLEYKLKID